MDITLDVTPDAMDMLQAWALLRGCTFRVIMMRGPTSGNPYVGLTVYKNADLVSLAHLDLLPE